MSDTIGRKDGMKDGRTAPRRIYLATLPNRFESLTAVVRVLSETALHMTIRITPFPQLAKSRSKTVTVLREDFMAMENTGLARLITRVPCASCRGIMTLYDGRKGNRTGIFLACSECEECLEV